jgi:hypothetical protein
VGRQFHLDATDGRQEHGFEGRIRIGAVTVTEYTSARHCHMVQQFTWLGAVLSPRILGISLVRFHVGSMLVYVVLEQVFCNFLRVCPANHQSTIIRYTVPIAFLYVRYS